ncbi:MAG TPA: hypothetical protein VGI39_43775 [Polyangiaceae bacterium]|jgi:hypothetical protein
MLDRRFTCVDCGAVSPEADEESMLISAKYGWRIVRRSQGEASALEARCAECWARHRAYLRAGSG